MKFKIIESFLDVLWRSLLFCALTLAAVEANAQTYHLANLHSDSGIQSRQTALFTKVLQSEAQRVFPDGAVSKASAADADIRPALKLTEAGTKLVIERYSGKTLLSVTEVTELESLGADAYARAVSHALREVVFGKFQRPATASATASATSNGTKPGATKWSTAGIN